MAGQPGHEGQCSEGHDVLQLVQMGRSFGLGFRRHEGQPAGDGQHQQQHPAPAATQLGSIQEQAEVGHAGLCWPRSTGVRGDRIKGFTGRRPAVRLSDAGVAQLVEQRIRNAKVGSSTLLTGTKP
jgi:hypothetical protein